MSVWSAEPVRDELGAMSPGSVAGSCFERCGLTPQRGGLLAPFTYRLGLCGAPVSRPARGVLGLDEPSGNRRADAFSNTPCGLGRRGRLGRFAHGARPFSVGPLQLASRCSRRWHRG